MKCFICIKGGIVLLWFEWYNKEWLLNKMKIVGINY